MTASSDTLSETLLQLDGMQQISRLLHRLCYYMDRNDVERWLGCFTADGSWTYYAFDAPEPLFDLHGQDELQEFIEANAVKNADFRLKHLIANEDIEIRDSRSAASTCYYFTHSRNEDGNGFITRTSGRYLDEFARGDDGRWLLSGRTVRLDMGVAPSK